MQSRFGAPAPLPSRADQELMARAALAGGGVTPRQLKRWRLAGLVPSPTRKGLGRGRGSCSSYPPGTLERVVALAKLPRRSRAAAPATLSLFALGFPVDEVILRRAHAEWTARTLEKVARAAQSRDPLSLAEAAAKSLLRPFARTGPGRQYLRRLRGRAESPRSVLLSAMTALTSVVISGVPSSSEAFGEYLDATGAATVLEAVGVPRGQAAQAFLADASAVKALGTLSLEGLCAVYAKAPLGELEVARDDLNSVLNWMRGPGLRLLQASPLGPMVTGLGEDYLQMLEEDLVGRAAFGVPTVLMLRRLLGRQLPDFVAWVTGLGAAAA